ncbi:hypothetical protein JCM11641_002356 [Rhodosporidiobolus odoratus]
MKGLASSPSDPEALCTAPSKRSRFPQRLLAVLALCCLISFTSPFETTATFNGLRRLVLGVKDWVTPLPRDPYQRGTRLLGRSPVIDGHIDLPILARWYYANQIDDPEFDLRAPTKGEVDIPRLRKGKVGGFFWSVFVPCAEDLGYPEENDGNFTTPTWRVRDTLEQIDTARLLMEKYDDVFEFAATAKDWRKAIEKGKIAGMLGVEGGHQLGSSLSTLRTYYSLGARYVTLTHTCNSPLADSCGYMGKPVSQRWDGLSPFGKVAVKEMNRLGMMVDVSHTHPKSASDALTLSEAPVIFSHSNARGVHDVVRNVPDSILRRIGNLDPTRRGKFNLSEDGEHGQGWGADTHEIDREIPGGDAIVMLNFSPPFVTEGKADVRAMADHADYIGRLAGRQHVGIGSDFDGIESTPEGLEDVSTYPNLIAELIRRGWSDKEIRGLASENILRILDKVEAVTRKLKHVKPYTDVFAGRSDLQKHESRPGLLAEKGEL